MGGRLVADLTEPYRSTILLRYSEGMEPTEIARKLGLPPGTVRWRLKRAMDRLRAEIERGMAQPRRSLASGCSLRSREPCRAVALGRRL